MTEAEAVRIARVFARCAPAPPLGSHPRTLTRAHPALPCSYDGPDSRLDKQQLRRLTADLGQPLSDAEVTVAMSFLDEDGNGVVDFNEFVSYWTGTRRIKAGAAGAAKPAAAAAKAEDAPAE